MHEILLQVPVYTPCLLALAGRNLTALVLRVNDLKSFRQPSLRLQVAFAGYGDADIYLACVAFRVYDDPASPLEGDAYLNPRQGSDRKALENLTRQEIFPFIFLSEDLKDLVGKSISWQPQSRDAARDVFDLTASRPASTGLIDGSFDPDFQRVKDKFQSIHSVKDILAGQL